MQVGLVLLVPFKNVPSNGTQTKICFPFFQSSSGSSGSKGSLSLTLWEDMPRKIVPEEEDKPGDEDDDDDEDDKEEQEEKKEEQENKENKELGRKSGGFFC